MLRQIESIKTDSPGLLASFMGALMGQNYFSKSLRLYTL